MKRYLSQSHGVLDERDLIEAETKMIKFPKSYRALLLSQNGGVARPKGDSSGFVFYGIYDGPRDLRSAWHENLGVYERHLIPVAEDNNNIHVLVSAESGEVCYDGELVASGILSFLEEFCLPIEEENRSIIQCILDSRVGDIENLIRNGNVDVNAQAEFGHNLIQYAIMLKKPEVIELLLRLGADVSGCLHVMLSEGQPNMKLIRQLLDHGADVDEKDADGMSVLDHDSIWTKHISELSSEHGEDRAKDDMGERVR